MTLSRLRSWAELKDQVRTFFRDRGFLEVDTPLVNQEIIPETHIEPYFVPGLGYLQASPEMWMKRLLCDGSGPIFQLAKAFRAGERGPLHRPEFTMLEWYRPGDSMQQGIALLDELMQTVAHTPPAAQTSYREAFERTLQIDPHTCPLDKLQQLAGEQYRSHDADRDDLLNFLLAHHVEPTLGRDRPEIVYHYPATQAALATQTLDAEQMPVAERFELYWQGIELANGYHELADPQELRQRLEQANRQRQATDRPPLPLPEQLLAELEALGLPACTGVALGFDRLHLLMTGEKNFNDTLGEQDSA